MNSSNSFAVKCLLILLSAQPDNKELVQAVKCLGNLAWLGTKQRTRELALITLYACVYFLSRGHGGSARLIKQCLLTLYLLCSSGHRIKELLLDESCCFPRLKQVIAGDPYSVFASYASLDNVSSDTSGDPPEARAEPATLHPASSDSKPSIHSATSSVVEDKENDHDNQAESNLTATLTSFLYDKISALNDEKTLFILSVLSSSFDDLHDAHWTWTDQADLTQLVHHIAYEQRLSNIKPQRLSKHSFAFLTRSRRSLPSTTSIHARSADSRSQLKGDSSRSPSRRIDSKSHLLRTSSIQNVSSKRALGVKQNAKQSVQIDENTPLRSKSVKKSTVFNRAGSKSPMNRRISFRDIQDDEINKNTSSKPAEEKNTSQSNHSESATKSGLRFRKLVPNIQQSEEEFNSDERNRLLSHDYVTKQTKDSSSKPSSEKIKDPCEMREIRESNVTRYENKSNDSSGLLMNGSFELRTFQESQEVKDYATGGCSENGGIVVTAQVHGSNKNYVPTHKTKEELCKRSEIFEEKPNENQNENNNRNDNDNNSTDGEIRSLDYNDSDDYEIESTAGYSVDIVSYSSVSSTADLNNYNENRKLSRKKRNKKCSRISERVRRACASKKCQIGLERISECCNRFSESCRQCRMDVVTAWYRFMNKEKKKERELQERCSKWSCFLLKYLVHDNPDLLNVLLSDRQLISALFRATRWDWTEWRENSAQDLLIIMKHASAGSHTSSAADFNVVTSRSDNENDLKNESQYDNDKKEV